MRISECGCLGSRPKELLRQREGPAVIFWRRPSLFHSTDPRLVKTVILRERQNGPGQGEPGSPAAAGLKA